MSIFAHPAQKVRNALYTNNLSENKIFPLELPITLKPLCYLPEKIPLWNGILQTDSDILRLMVRTSSESHEKLGKVLKRLDQIRPETISIETLRRMQAEIHTNYAELAEQGLAYEEAAQEAIEKADPEILKRVTTRAARLRKSPPPPSSSRGETT